MQNWEMKQQEAFEAYKETLAGNPMENEYQRKTDQFVENQKVIALDTETTGTPNPGRRRWP